MRRWRTSICGAFLVLGTTTSAGAQTARSYDHVHFSVPDPKAAQEWYTTHLGGVVGESPDRLTFGGMPYSGRPPLPVQLLWARSAAGAPPVSGSAIASLGFSVRDLDAKVSALRAAGVKIVTNAHDIPGLWKAAMIEDPWGTKLELVEDPELIGFHHVTLLSPEPAAALAWYVDEFGGARTRIKGQMDAVKYGNMYLVAAKGDAGPLVPGYGLNHIGFAATSIDALAARLRGHGVKFTLEPRETLNQYGHRIAYVEGPNVVRIELVEHTKCMFTAGPDEHPAGAP
jgi:catechol 2,3-dioxygenase-like lactoylglutathione lyase family enzyme